MAELMRTRMGQMLETALAFAPWVVSMFTLYWLEYAQIWTTETAHRGKTSVAILVCGMGSSFFVWSALARRKKS